MPEGDWRTFVFVGVVVGLWVLAIWASPVAVAAIPAIYPLVFSSWPLGTALVVTTAINLIPLALVLLGSGHSIAESRYGHCHYARRRGRDTGDRHRDHDVDAAAPQAGRSGRRLAASRAESARLSREAGAAAERERLAREIHDTLAQGFTSIVALAQAVEPELETDRRPRSDTSN